MSNSPVVSRPNVEGVFERWMSPSHPETSDAPAFDMSITVGENTARELGLTRRDVDEGAAYSHRQAVASIDAGLQTTPSCQGHFYPRDRFEKIWDELKREEPLITDGGLVVKGQLT